MAHRREGGIYGGGSVGLTSSSNCCLDEGVELLVSSDGQLEMTGSDPLYLEVLAAVACQL